MDNVIPFPGAEVAEYPNLSELAKERIRVHMLTRYLDKTDPQWRTKIKDVLDAADQ